MIAETLQANLALAAAALVVLMARRPVRRAFGARAAYGLWALPPLAALAGLAPKPAAETLLSPFVVQAAGAVADAAAPMAQPSTGLMLTALWIAGVLAAGGLLAVRQARFVAEVRAGRAGPAVVGVLAPRIVTPADFAERFGADERAVILSHEAQHLARGDAAANALAAAVQCLCWFNPLVHVGARAMRIDQELACDEAVVAEAPGARRLYAQVLLKTQLAAQPLPLGCHWPAASQHPLKERIAMLKFPLPSAARRVAGLGVVAALSLGGAAVAWAAQGPAGFGDVAADAPATITHPVSVEKPTAEDLVRNYPTEAAAKGIEGDTLITCRVKADGRFDSCAVTRAKALGAEAYDMDFGTAALRLALLFRMAPADVSHAKTAGGIVRIPIRFRLPAAS